jgi:hypothetical protein
MGYTQALLHGGLDFSVTEPRDRDYFYLWGFSAWGVWAALGLVAVWQALGRLVANAAGAHGDRPAAAPGRRPALLASPILVLAFVPLFVNWTSASRAGEVFTRDWAVDILNSVEPYSILITNGDNDTFPLWYAQQVEGVRKDVIVGVTTYLGIDWFARQMIRRPIYEYDAAKGPAIYRGAAWPKPSGSPLDMTLAEADSIPQYVMLRQPQQFRHGNITTTIQPGVLTRSEIVTLRLIADAYPERPIYFVAGGFARRLGLTPYLLTQGLVQKLEPHKVETTPETPSIRGGEHLDIARTAALWNTVYRGPSDLIEQGDWVDQASTSSAINYAVVGFMLAGGLRQQGDTATARGVMDTVTGVIHAARLEELFGVSR